MRSLYTLFALVVVCLLIACKPGQPSDVLSESRMEEILYDYHLAQSAAEASTEDVDKMRYQYVQRVFQKHGITEAEFNTSMIWYAQHAVLMDKMYQRLSQRFEAEAKGLGIGVSETELNANLSADGMEANIWSGRRLLFLSNDPLSNLLTLTLKADTTFHPGDNYKLGFDAHFVSTKHRTAYAFLQVFYKDGTNKSAFRLITSESSYMLTLPPDINNNDRETDRIVITFYYECGLTRGEPSFFYLTNPSLVRSHRPEDEKGLAVPSAQPTEVDSARTLAPNVQPEREDTLRSEHTEVRPQHGKSDAPVERVMRERQVRRPMMPARGTSSSPRPQRR